MADHGRRRSLLPGRDHPPLHHGYGLAHRRSNASACRDDGQRDRRHSLGARLRLIGFRIGLSLASAIAGLIIFGLLRPLELRAYAEGGYGAFSMNLLAPIDPGEFGALVLKPQPEVGIFQYEGYNYLGLGVILLGTLALARRPSLFVRNLCRREAAATWLICAVSLFLALSLKATVGSWTIYEFPFRYPFLRR